MAKKINKIGYKFGNLTVVSVRSEVIGGKKRSVCNCECSCGNTREMQWDILKRGKTTECLTCKEAKQMSRTPEYEAWCNAKARCFNPNNPYYPNYGGRGITMCDEFKNNFQAFYDEVGPRPKTGKWCIDREDFDGNYEPGNLRWVPRNVSDSNKGKPTSNTSGEKNIYLDKRPGRAPYRVEVSRKGKKHRLGGFDTMAEAIKARDEFIKNYGY